jgi:two-component system sensor histidine kinase/response regulator
VDDGAAALHAVEEKGPYDLVLMDINMPVMNGYEATEAIRKIYDPETMPIVALTADAMDEDIQKVKEHGMQEHLTKPIDVVSLYDTLFRYLHQTKENGVTKDTKEEEDPRYYRLSQISQFDSDTALEQVGGSKSLYLSLVEDFINIYRDALVKVRSFNAGKEYAEGIHYMHDFKGAAGNIGSIVLFTLAKSIEEEYRHHDDAALAKLADELEGTLRDLTVQIEYALFPERQKKEDGALDTEHTRLLRNLLRSARKKKVLESVNLISKLRETEWPKSHYKPLYDVIMALEQYRFSEAVEKLEAMGIEEAR